jgi:hypothetical protein
MRLQFNLDFVEPRGLFLVWVPSLETSVNGDNQGDIGKAEEQASLAVELLTARTASDYPRRDLMCPRRFLSLW